jgi:hypothetical protein
MLSKKGLRTLRHHLELPASRPVHLRAIGDTTEFYFKTAWPNG